MRFRNACRVCFERLRSSSELHSPFLNAYSNILKTSSNCLQYRCWIFSFIIAPSFYEKLTKRSIYFCNLCGGTKVLCYKSFLIAWPFLSRAFKLCKWSLYLLISACIIGSWMFKFDNGSFMRCKPPYSKLLFACCCGSWPGLSSISKSKSSSTLNSISWY